MTSELVSQIAAWWGAIVATIVLAWDIYKFRATGPKLTLLSRSNFDWFFDDPQAGKKLFVKAVNRGEVSVRLTRLELRFYKNWIFRIIGIQSSRYVVNSDMFTGEKEFPYVLNPTSSWAIACQLFSSLQAEALKGHLVLELYCDQLRGPLKSRVRILKEINLPEDSNGLMQHYYKRIA
jgi:hypothetical protein